MTAGWIQICRAEAAKPFSIFLTSSQKAFAVFPRKSAMTMGQAADQPADATTDPTDGGAMDPSAPAMPANSDPSQLDRERLGIHRSFHRKQQDRASHGEAGVDTPPIILDHALVPENTPRLIDDPREAQEVFDALHEAGQFGYDTEFIGETTFFPKLCVVQVSTGHEVWLLDPISEVDLTPLWEMVADPQVETIIHAGQQDLEPVYRLLGRPAKNVFDTQVAAGFIGLDYPISLVNLVQKVLGADLGHGAKFSQWDRRPLSDLQRHYAANDVRYLPLLRRVLADLLDDASKTAWAQEELSRFESEDLYRFDPQSQKLKGIRMASLSRRQKHVLKALVDWRGKVAVEQDVPTRSLLRDETLGELVQQMPKEPDQFMKVKGIPKLVKQTCATQIAKVIREADAETIAEETRGRYFNRSKHGPIVERLWKGVAPHCKAEGISQPLAINKSELTRFVVDPSAPSRLTTGWRKTFFADILAKVDEPAED